VINPAVPELNRNRKNDGYPQRRSAVATIVRSLACSSAAESALPRMEVANPHCGDSARRSSGTWRAASWMPAALLVAATKMETECNARTLSEDDVVELEPALGRPPPAFVVLAIGGIEERIVGSVELDVFAAEPYELVDLLAEDLGDIGQEALQARIGAA
jgi:hypothetical protein